MSDKLKHIPRAVGDRKSALDPYWESRWLPPLDAAALYAFVATVKPRRYVEIGSGLSTLFTRRAIDDHGLDSEVISIDPEPRIEVDGACNVVVRKALEDVDLSLFCGLEQGDIVFVDGSHRVLMNSDVTAFFLDVLPMLRRGVIVHFHDIWLPCDYPKHWRYWLFSEQYMLATCLLMAPERLRVVLPAMFISIHPSLSKILEPLWDELGLQETATHGGSLWIEMQ